MSCEVTLTFVLDEDVTPDYLAERVALACSRGALRPGESIRLPSDPSARYVITDGPVELPEFLRQRQQPQGPQDVLEAWEDLPDRVRRERASAVQQP